MLPTSMEGSTGEHLTMGQKPVPPVNIVSFEPWTGQGATRSGEPN